jgi:hypothetical protein
MDSLQSRSTTVSRELWTCRPPLYWMKPTDLLLVHGDPTKEITATRDIVAVWKAGVLVQRRRRNLVNATVVVSRPPSLEADQPSPRMRWGRLGSASPASAVEARYHVEVLVAAQDGQAMLQGEGRDPGVVGRDRTPRSLEIHA